MRVANGVGAVMFAIFALLQLNDPDPFGWFVVYGLGAALFGLAAAGQGSRSLQGAYALLCGSWMVFLVAGGSLWAAPVNFDNEVFRELLGLVLLTAWALANVIFGVGEPTES